MHDNRLSNICLSKLTQALKSSKNEPNPEHEAKLLMPAGLDIHFYHVKPQVTSNTANLRVLPLLILHGWPGSVVEFQKIIPMLTTPRPDRNFVFEVIAPSLPGFAFSQAAVRPGLGPAQVNSRITR